jgi:2-polyprenyl-3-methyl-5-hydroxy-6-metoxy-1,4-benzoquinol methylase
VTGEEAEVDLDQVIAEIRAAVDENTASGVYPPELETELSSHYARLLDRSDGRDRFDSVRAAINRVAETGGLSRARIDTTSGLPGGQLVHRAAGKAVSRQVLGIMDQVNQFAAAVVPAMLALADLVEDPRAHSHEDVLHEIDTVQDRLAEVERAIGDMAAVVEVLHSAVPRLLAYTDGLDGLAARIDALEQAERRQRFEPTFSSIDFDAVSRGDQEAIRAEYALLADSLVGVPGPVVDIGAGRGELLELLRGRGVEAWGVELETDLVELATAHGLDVRLEDGLDALRTTPQLTLGAVVLLHVIEHLGKNELMELVQLAWERLAIGGKLVLETPNPQSLYVYARAFYLDPTHSQPVHPIYLEFLLRQVGFKDIVFEWTAPPSDAERLVEVPGDDAATKANNENVRRINDLVFAPQNYRVVATR